MTMNNDLSTGQYQTFNAYWRARINREEALRELELRLKKINRKLVKSSNKRRWQDAYIKLALEIEKVRKQ
jgi:hypothetical protein